MANANETQLLYITYFGRPADPAGLAFWSTGAGAALTLSEAADEFAGTTEFQGTIGSQSVTDAVNSFYVNLFGRNADAAGLLFWVNAVNNNVVSLQQVGLEIAKSALSQPNGSPDKVAIQAKVEASLRWTAVVASSAQSQQEYAGPLANTFGVDFLVPVTTIATIPSVAATQVAVDGLPPVGTVGLLSSNATSVSEGGTVIFEIQTIPDLAGKTIAYELTGVQAADVVGGSLTGNVLISATGVGTVQVTIAEDGVIDPGETLEIIFPNEIIFAKPPGGESVNIIDTTPPVIPSLQVQAIPAAVNEGATLTFDITTENIATGTVLTYTLSGVSSSDVNNALLTSTVVVNASGTAVVQFLISADLSTEGPEEATLVVTGGGASGSAKAIINDTSIAPTTVGLTVNTDIITASTASTFTFFGNESTLGQNDQLTGRAGTNSVLNVGTNGSFSIDNFTTNGIQTLELNPGGETLWDSGSIDLSRAFGLNGESGSASGLVNINVNQSKLGSVLFNDIQSAVGFETTVTDSISDLEYNFDINATQGDTAVLVTVAETPIDALSGEAVGFDFTQGPLSADAGIELLGVQSLGPITNVIDMLSVGADLEGLIIFGEASLEITSDLGLDDDNLNIEFIDAQDLDADLTLTYTSALGDPANLDNNVADVTVFGAVGENVLTLGSIASPNPTDFLVLTQNSNDTVFTAGGADEIFVGGGNNVVDAGDGTNSITAGPGNDSLVSGSGNDLIDAGAGNNTVESGGGADTVTTLGGNDVIDAGNGNDSISSGDGNDSIDAGEGNDRVISGNGNNTIDAGPGNDYVSAGLTGSGSGNNLIFTGNGNNTVETGSGLDSVYIGNGNDSISTGAGNDYIQVDAESLTIADRINGGAGTADVLALSLGGLVSESETLGVSRIEEFRLLGGSDYSLTLSNPLIATSDNLVGGVRRFLVDALPAAGDVTLDLSKLSPVDGDLNFIGITYDGQADTNTETVIIRDALLSSFTTLSFGDAPLDQDETFADILRILDSADVTADDLINVSGLEVIELASSANGPQTFTIELTDAIFNTLVGPDNTNNGTPDVLRIVATPSLGGFVSTLNLNLAGLSAANRARVFVEQSADLNVFTNPPGALPPSNITTALFFTPNADRFPIASVVPGNPPFIPDGSIVTAFQAGDVQPFDYVNANEVTDGPGGFETILFKYAISNTPADLSTQVGGDFFFPATIFGIDLFEFMPAAINQAVSFTNLGLYSKSQTGLDSVKTAGGSDLLLEINDDLFVGSDGGNDTVTAAAYDTDFMDASISLTVDAGEGNDSVVGGYGPNSLYGGNGNDVLEVLQGPTANGTYVGGNDTVIGGAGSDTIRTGVGNDIVWSGERTSFNDSLDTAGNFINTTYSGPNVEGVVDPNADRDTVIAGAFNDTIVTGVGNDSVKAGEGNNSVLAGGGADWVLAGAGNDLIALADDLGLDNDSTSSGAGSDSIQAGLGNDSILAGADNDFISLGLSFGTSGGNGTPAVIGDLGTTTYGGLSNGDVVDGGTGTEVLFFSFEGAGNPAGRYVGKPNVLGTSVISSVETFVIGLNTADRRVEFNRESAIQAGGELTVFATDLDNGIANSLRDFSEYTSTETVDFTIWDLEGTLTKGGKDTNSVGGNTVVGGSGTDTLSTFGAPGRAANPQLDGFVAGDIEGDYLYFGLGGSDTINLKDEATFIEGVGYQSIDDGGNSAGGVGTGGDIITGFRQFVPVAGEPNNYLNTEDLVLIGGSLKANILNYTDPLVDNFGGHLKFVSNSAVDFDGFGFGSFTTIFGSFRQDGLILANGIAGSDLNNVNNIASAINGLGIDSAVGQGGLVVVQGATSSALYAFSENGVEEDNVSIDELYQLGIFQGEQYLGSITDAGTLITGVSGPFASANFVGVGTFVG
ncbi:DUF4214 domain-containing protein [Synechococcus sp. EJ6-Ellesmere]|uniref:DUF4214 domain-containing protein n=1 Tax=Synechococcus sp. EJ6-Ellesmere TaxID=2823734 RepID=UPI0020CCD056|nr:DUF4214 domain-containing protein [Synechococcus sp. EJ6-Ellesmere]MCP9824136.1 DUF4214 domain-containing protein [Synechococcus sp. EJ6-Ellesmere]